MDQNTSPENTEITNFKKKKSKKFVIDGKTYDMKFGSRRQVFNGTAYMTKGKMKQGDIIYNKQRRLVSAKKSKTATKEQRLKRYGYSAKKGKFGYVKIEPSGSLAATRKLGRRKSNFSRSRSR